jgi:hypothetical protein
LDTTRQFTRFLTLSSLGGPVGEHPEGKAVKLGMDYAWAKRKAGGRPVVVDRINADLVVQIRSEGKTWREIAEAHPPVKSARGKRVRPSAGSIPRAYAAETMVLWVKPVGKSSSPE